MTYHPRTVRRSNKRRSWLGGAVQQIAARTQSTAPTHNISRHSSDIHAIPQQSFSFETQSSITNALTCLANLGTKGGVSNIESLHFDGEPWAKPVNNLVIPSYDGFSPIAQATIEMSRHAFERLPRTVTERIVYARFMADGGRMPDLSDLGGVGDVVEISVDGSSSRKTSCASAIVAQDDQGPETGPKDDRGSAIRRHQRALAPAPPVHRTHPAEQMMVDDTLDFYQWPVRSRKAHPEQSGPEVTSWSSCEAPLQKVFASSPFNEDNRVEASITRPYPWIPSGVQSSFLGAAKAADDLDHAQSQGFPCPVYRPSQPQWNDGRTFWGPLQNDIAQSLEDIVNTNAEMSRHLAGDIEGICRDLP